MIVEFVLKVTQIMMQIVIKMSVDHVLEIIAHVQVVQMIQRIIIMKDVMILKLMNLLIVL